MRFKDCSVMVFIQSHCCTSWHFKILRKLSPLNLCLESLYSISSISEHSLMAYFIFDEAAICMQVFCSPNFPFLWFQNKWATLFSFLLVLIQQMYTTSNVIVFAEEKIQKLHFSTAVQYFLKNACHWPAETDFYSTCSNIWLKEMWKPEYFVTSAHRINFSSYKKIVSKSEEYSLFLCQRILCSVQLKYFFFLLLCASPVPSPSTTEILPRDRPQWCFIQAKRFRGSCVKIRHFCRLCECLLVYVGGWVLIAYHPSV